MRSDGNFHPEWGYLSPSRSFMRSLRIALVSTAIGATSGAAVVFSLVEGPGSNDTSVAARALVTKAPVITAPAGTASFINSTAAAALIAGSARPKSPAADIPLPAPDATPASTTSAVASAQKPNGTASRAVVRTSDNAAGSTENPRIVEATRAMHARLAKVMVKKKSLPRKRHWQTATNARNYRHYGQEFRPYGQEFRPSFQYPDSRQFVQLGFGETRNGW
jgi:hypothetical protein